MVNIYYNTLCYVLLFILKMDKWIKKKKKTKTGIEIKKKSKSKKKK